MRRTSLCRLGVLMLLGLPGVHGQPPLAGVIDRVREGFREEETLRLVSGIWENDRWFTTTRFRATAEYLKQRLADAGAGQVEILESPADGKTQAGFWTMPMAWDVSRATLEITKPPLPSAQAMLADYQVTPQSVCTWSGATPAEGIQAGLVEWDERTEAHAAPDHYRGKFVLTREDPSGIKWLLARAGVAGVVSSFSENPSLAEGRQWISGWGDQGWPFIGTSTPLPCFSITPRAGDALRKMLASGGEVRLKGLIDARHREGSLYSVTGVLQGTDPGQEVLMLGHTSEPGAQDNATGVAAMVESLAVLRRLIDSGKLPKPRRTIRVLAMPEMFGSLSYIQKHPERMKRTVAAICLDTPAGDYSFVNTEYTFYLNPLVASSFTDAWIVRTAETYFARHVRSRKWRWRPFVGGTDNYLSDPLIGVPTVFPYSGSGVHTHHNSEDTPDDVDPRSMRDLVSIAASFVYSIAAAGDEDLIRFAETAAARGHEMIARAALDEMDKLAAAQTPSSLEAASRTAREKIRFVAGRQTQAVESVLRLAPVTDSRGLRASLDALSQSLSALAATYEERVHQAELRQRASLGNEPTAGLASEPKPARSDTDSMRVKRRRFGTIPLDTIPPGEREGFEPALFDGPAVIALWWCDGRRTLDEVIRLTELELGPSDFDFAGYFRFLERKGFVAFVTGSDSDSERR